MLRIIPITSFADHPLLAPYSTMRRMAEHREAGLFVAEGPQVVERLLRSELGVQSLLMPPVWAEKFRSLAEERPEEIHMFVAERALLEQLTGFQLYQGVLAVGLAPKPIIFAELLLKSKPPRLLLALDGVTSADNMGQLVRTAAAFCVQGILTSQTSCSVWLRRTVRTSMGAVFQIPALEQIDLPENLRALKNAGVRLIAAHPGAGGLALPDASFRGDCCIVLGSEGHGISHEALELMDEQAAIPMPPGVDSLNVNAAAAVFLYEASRQRAG